MEISSLNLLRLKTLDDMAKDGTVIYVSLADEKNGIVQIECDTKTQSIYIDKKYDYGMTMECILAIINYKYKDKNNYCFIPEYMDTLSHENSSALLCCIREGKTLSISAAKNHEIWVCLDDNCISKSDSVINALLEAEQVFATDKIINPYESFCLYRINETINFGYEIYITKGKDGYDARVGKWEKFSTFDSSKYKIVTVGRGETVMEALVAADCKYKIGNRIGYYTLPSKEKEVLDAIDPISYNLGDGDILKIAKVNDRAMTAYLYNNATQICHHVSKAGNVWNLLFDMQTWLIENPFIVKGKILNKQK